MKKKKKRASAMLATLLSFLFFKKRDLEKGGLEEDSLQEHYETL